MTLEEKCQRYWAEELGINNPDDLKTYIAGIFRQHSNSNSDTLIGLHKMIFPEWDTIQSVNWYPTVGQELFDNIHELFLKYHPDEYIDYWEQYGFEMDSMLDPWQVSFDNCPVIYHTPRTLRKARHKYLKSQH